MTSGARMARRVLIIGKNGQLGFELIQLLQDQADVVAVDVDELDLSKPAQIRSFVRSTKAALIINAAAYTDVEKAEDEPALAEVINGQAPGVMAEEAKATGAGLIHYSTDYVFDGTKNLPYLEDDVPHPLSAYGRSKLSGELTIRASDAPYLILRTSWLYGSRGRNFLLTMIRLSDSRQELRVVNDQIGAPTWCRSLAEATVTMITKLNWTLPQPGAVYHATAGGHTTWYDFAREIIASVNNAQSRSVRVLPVPSSEYPTKARRPMYSVLSNEKLWREMGIKLPSWEDDLRSVLRLVLPE